MIHNRVLVLAVLALAWYLVCEILSSAFRSNRGPGFESFPTITSDVFRWLGPIGIGILVLTWIVIVGLRPH